jgi:hypothetical protein
MVANMATLTFNLHPTTILQAQALGPAWVEALMLHTTWCHPKAGPLQKSTWFNIRLFGSALPRIPD